MADVPYPILGADALAHFHFLPDLTKKTLVHPSGQIYGYGTTAPIENDFASLTIIDQAHPYSELLRKFPSVIGATEPLPVQEEQKVYHYIETKGPPVALRARKLCPERLKIAKEEFKKLCDAGLMRPSKSPWASPIHMVQKGKGFRIVGDYRCLNAQTKPDRYPVKRLLDFTTILKGCKVFSTLDLKRAYNQIPVNLADVEKTAVITPFGLFESLGMTFGLKNGAQSMQRYCDAALGDLPFVFVYIDDILIASRTAEEHEKHLAIVLERLKKFALQLNLEKCMSAQPKVTFLGYTLSPTKIEAIVKFPKPQTVEQMRRFVGMMNFYRESIPKAAHSQMHLNKFFTSAKKKDKTPINWDAEAERAFMEFMVRKNLERLQCWHSLTKLHQCDSFAMPLIRLWAQLWKYRLIQSGSPWHFSRKSLLKPKRSTRRTIVS